MAIDFICPCCGYRATYSKEIMDKIFLIVCQYYKTNPEAALTIKPHRTVEGRVRNITVYFGRKMTGENLKLISAYFDKCACWAGEIYCRVNEAMCRNPKYKQQVEEIENIILNAFEK